MMQTWRGCWNSGRCVHVLVQSVRLELAASLAVSKISTVS